MQSLLNPIEIAPDRSSLERALRQLVKATALLAGYCEHVEHNEPNTVSDPLLAAEILRDVAVGLVRASGRSLVEAYSTRIRAVEERSRLRFSSCGESRLSGAELVVSARTWADLQIAQDVHDRQFHPDVYGLSKVDQLRHYTFHVAKLTGLLADAIDGEAWGAFALQRLPDIAIFGVKVASVCNATLPSAPASS